METPSGNTPEPGEIQYTSKVITSTPRNHWLRSALRLVLFFSQFFAAGAGSGWTSAKQDRSPVVYHSSQTVKMPPYPGSRPWTGGEGTPDLQLSASGTVMTGLGRQESMVLLEGSNRVIQPCGNVSPP